MKEVYETPKMEIVEFETEDVITTSAIELPFVPCVPKGNEQVVKWLFRKYFYGEDDFNENQKKQAEKHCHC